VFWRRHARSRISDTPTPVVSTVLSKPCRTASAKLTADLLAALAKTESDMQQSAATEQWPLDTAAQETAGAAAKEALNKKQWPAALKEFAKSIDLLMTAWKQHRKIVAVRDGEAKAAKEKEAQS